ncbi:MAG: LysR family transcriptional regulator [Roseobacter sp.]
MRNSTGESMNAQDHNWEDLRLVLAITQGQGLSGASRILSLHHATILRRLNAFEQRMGVVLFHRGARGYEPTEVGEELGRMALGIDQDVEDAYRRLAGQDLRLSGTIRLATSDFIAQSLLLPVLRSFRERQPSIEIEVSISPQFASLTKRDADVAFRAANTPPDNLVGRKIAKLGYGIYIHRSLLDRLGEHAGLEQLDWVGDDHSIAHVTTNQWRSREFPNARVRTRFDSLIGKFGAIRGKMGIGFLPHFLAISDPELVCLKSRPDRWTLDLWLLIHPDLRQMNRIKSFVRCAEDVLNHFDLSNVSETTSPLHF